MLRIEDIIKCSLTEIIMPMNLNGFKWGLHCDYKFLIKDNGRIPELKTKEEKILFAKKIMHSANEFDDYIEENINRIHRMAFPACSFDGPVLSVRKPRDEFYDHSRLILTVIYYSIHIRKKSDYTFSKKKEMTVEFQ